MARRTVEHRFLWPAGHAARFHADRLESLHGPFMLDELESFEGNRCQPVTVPVLIEPRSFFLIASQPAAAVRAVLVRLRHCVAPGSPVALHSDRKPLYERLGRRVFGRRFLWAPHSASTRRDRTNPLFPIHHTNARLRHFLARLRRRSWCVSKRRLRMQQHLDVASLWVNYCRPITNRTGTTPTLALGRAPRRYREEEVLAWREDWGRFPIAA